MELLNNEDIEQLNTLQRIDNILKEQCNNHEKAVEKFNNYDINISIRTLYEDIKTAIHQELFKQD